MKFDVQMKVRGHLLLKDPTSGREYLAQKAQRDTVEVMEIPDDTALGMRARTAIDMAFEAVRKRLDPREYGAVVTCHGTGPHVEELPIGARESGVGRGAPDAGLGRGGYARVAARSAGKFVAR